ncbi:aldehyde dehydrogenase family protein [Streptomyces sp. NPDC004237]|uniref:dihydrodipicolinate synthase family protein n=1 Tax=Streptomyces sp. NPDC004237 TaxID=3154455 RepID=UPI0033A49A59
MLGGDLDRARAEWARLYPLMDAIMSAPFIQAVKVALNAAGVPVGGPREPLLGLDAATTARIASLVGVDAAAPVRRALTNRTTATAFLAVRHEEPPLMTTAAALAAAGPWARRLPRERCELLHAIADRLDFGTVWVNSHLVLASEVPRGGFKGSGYGRDLSIYAFDGCTCTKHVMHHHGRRAAEPLSR